MNRHANKYELGVEVKNDPVKDCCLVLHRGEVLMEFYGDGRTGRACVFLDGLITGLQRAATSYKE